MVNVLRRSPLAGRESDLERLGVHDPTIATQLSVRTRTPAALGLPAEPNTWSVLERPAMCEALWLGPDEWLIVSSDPRDVVGAAFEIAASLVDVSANRVAIDLPRDEGGDPRDLLEQGCSIDLDPRSWLEGTCAQTLLARVPVLLQERGDAVRILARPSYANWLIDWLLAVSA